MCYTLEIVIFIITIKITLLLLVVVVVAVLVLLRLPFMLERIKILKLIILQNINIH